MTLFSANSNFVEPSSKERLDYLDSVCGLMILWMILGHIITNCDLKDSCLYIVGNRLFPFFMPWFFFKSGLFYKKQTDKDLVSNGGRKLLFPWLIFTVLSIVLLSWPRISEVGMRICFKETAKSILLLGTPNVNVTLWFLLTLFLVKYITNKLIGWGLRPYLIFLVTFVLACVINFFRSEYEGGAFYLRYPEFIYNTITGICFYCSGIVLKNKQNDKVFVLICFVIHLAIVSFLFSFVDMEHNKLIQGYYVLWMLSSITGIVLIDFVFKLFRQLPRCHFLEYIGKNSMIFYVTHFILIKMVALYLVPLCSITDKWLIFSLMIIVCSIIIPLLCKMQENKVLKWMLELK